MIPVRLADGDDRETWLEARRWIISSTDAARAMTPSGWSAVVMEKLYGHQRPDNRWFAHGRERESDIARQAEIRYGIKPNRHLWACGPFGATPDAIGDEALGEFKTGVKPLPATTPRQYRDQIYFAQHIFDLPGTWLGWEHHIDGVPAGIEPEWRWIPRDQNRINELIDNAQLLHDFIQQERSLAY